MNIFFKLRPALVSTAVITAVTLYGTGLTGCGKDEVKKNLSPVAVRVMTTQPGTQTSAKRFSGYTYPWEAAGVGFLIGGRVTSIKVSEGDHVKKGELLATIAPEDYELVHKLSETQVEAIKPNYERVLNLVEDEALPRAKLDEVEGMYKAAVMQRKQAKRQVSYTRLKAPIDGIVIDRGTAVGQVIGPGMPAAVVIDISKIKVKIGVAQKNLNLFTEGTELTVTMEGVDGAKKGTVHHISMIPDTTTRMYEVTVAVDNPDETIRPGMLTRVELETDRADGIFVLLRMVKRNSAGEHVVFMVNENDTVFERRVTIGEMFGELVLITEGLSEGERVIREGQSFVTVGNKVNVL